MSVPHRCEGSLLQEDISAEMLQQVTAQQATKFYTDYRNLRVWGDALCHLLSMQIHTSLPLVEILYLFTDVLKSDQRKEEGRDALRGRWRR